MDAKELLKALRARLGLTQEQLAERAELLRQEVNKIETGKNQVSTVRMLRALANAATSSLEDMDAYFAEKITLDELMTRIDARKRREAESQGVGDPFPNRALAAEICRLGGVSEEAVAAVLAEPPPAHDHTALEWIERMRLREIELRRGRVEASAKRRS